MTNNSKAPDFTGIFLVFCTLFVIATLSLMLRADTIYANDEIAGETHGELSISTFAENERKSTASSEALGLWERFALLIDSLIKE